mmetsp:Transcript_7684/g.14532  ORF Transcript_7684/g.14532 Transcript_7684/m.14532 type:complete len:531 (-) Transcript_7684:9478-11070(-)
MIERVSLTKALLALALHVTLFALLEKDERMLWMIMDSFKKSDANHKAIFDQSEDAVFIVNLQGKVEYANTKAKTQMAKSPSRFIEDIFPPPCKQILARLLKTISTGGRESEEVILKPNSLNFDPAQLKDYAVKLEAKPISWKQTNCMLLTADDITYDKAKSILIYSRHKKAMNLLTIQTRELERTYSERQLLRRVDLERQLKAKLEFTKIGFLEMSTIGSAEVDLVRFSPFDECLRTIELLIEKAFERRIEVLLTKETNMPQVVRGNIEATNILTSCIVEFALCESEPGGSVHLYLEVVPTSEKDFRLRFRVVFKGCRVKNDRLQQLFRKEPASLEETALTLAKYGLSLTIFRSVLESLEGSFDEAYVQEGSTDRTVVAYSIPFGKEEGLAGRVNSIHLEYTHNIVNTNTVKWPRTMNSVDALPLPAKEFISMSTNATISRRNITKTSSYPRGVLSSLCRLPDAEEDEKEELEEIERKAVSFCESVDIRNITESCAGTDEQIQLPSESIEEEITVGPITNDSFPGWARRP